MDREVYLSEKWVRYPAMPGDASDALFSAENQFLHGRILKLAEERFDLGWAGRTLSFDLAGEPAVGVFDETGRFQSHGAGKEVLAEGDLVRIEQNRSVIRGIQLLVAASKSGAHESCGKIEQSRRWQEFISAVREYFTEKAFIEVETPYLVSAPGAEEHLRFFETEWRFGSGKKTFYLPTSPEIHMKKLLASGYDRIFEIKTCFRNEELSPLHQPEFSLLEWYRSFSHLEKIMDDVEGLIVFLRQKGFGGESAAERVRRVSVRELFSEVLAVELNPSTGRDELAGWVKRFSLDWHESDSWDDLFFRLMIEKIEPALAGRGPVFVYDYPPSQCALARLSSQGWARRFEFYWRGVEVANAFDELNDPEEQKQRLDEVVRKRRENGYENLALDAEFIGALESGMPPSGGIALGLERLFMTLEQIAKIEDVKLFPHRSVRD